MKYRHDLKCLELETRLETTPGIFVLQIYPENSGQHLTWDGHCTMMLGVPVIKVHDTLVGDDFVFGLADVTEFEVQVFAKMLYDPPAAAPGITYAEDFGVRLLREHF